MTTLTEVKNRLLKLKEKETLLLFFIIVVPNILRQVLYYVAQTKTGQVGFIASYETIKIYSVGFPVLGVLEEIGIGVAFIIFWVLSDKLRFFAYGWVFDALFDFISVAVWGIFGATPLQMLGLSHKVRFFIREILFSYIIFGPLLWYKKVNLKLFSYVTTAFAVGTILLILLI